MHIDSLITELLSHARLAPSVHNTQPWRFIVKGSVIFLVPVKERFLCEGDPTNRELWISLGSCLETLLQSAKGIGVEIKTKSIQTDSLDHPVAEIECIGPLVKIHHEIIDAIKARHSYRGKLQNATLPKDLLRNYKRIISDIDTTSIYIVKDRVAIQAIANYTYKGMRLALSNPKFRKELAALINYNWSQNRIGMHGFVLNRNTILGSVWEKWSIRYGIRIHQKAYADKIKVLDASGIIFITTDGDVPHFWLNAGRAYTRIALQLTKDGLVHSTIAAPIEAANFHEDTEELLHANGRVQAMIRIGHPTAYTHRTSPRLELNELLT